VAISDLTTEHWAAIAVALDHRIDGLEQMRNDATNLATVRAFDKGIKFYQETRDLIPFPDRG